MNMGTITLLLNEEFHTWWFKFNPHIAKDQTKMLLAWEAYKLGRKNKKEWKEPA